MHLSGRVERYLACRGSSLIVKFAKLVLYWENMAALFVLVFPLPALILRYQAHSELTLSALSTLGYPLDRRHPFLVYLKACAGFSVSSSGTLDEIDGR